jgi:hypothetical protein
MSSVSERSTASAASGGWENYHVVGETVGIVILYLK